MGGLVSWLLAVVGFAIVAAASGQSRAADLTTLVSFNNVDGAEPSAGLIADAKGNLFGPTGSGGAGVGPNGLGSGTVFEIAKVHHGYASTPTTLASFCALANCADGRSPGGTLIADAKGNLFGTTTLGGANDRGTVFEIVKTASGYASTPTTLVRFCAGGFPCADGYEPDGGLIADATGNLFGTTSAGGANGEGTVFEIAKTVSGYASTPTTLVSFCAGGFPCTDGLFPSGDLTIDADGSLFGTAGGGANGGGTVFEIIKTASGYASTPTTLVSFCALTNCADGELPSGGLIIDAKGNLFGTTRAGGANGRQSGQILVGGTVFEIIKTASGYASTPTTLVSFCSLAKCADGESPTPGLIADAKGNLFGTTSLGGAGVTPSGLGGGTVFEIVKTAQGGHEADRRNLHHPGLPEYASSPITLVSFCMLANCADGELPNGGLIADAKGNLFGTTFVGGANGGSFGTLGGTVFEITDSGFVASHKFAGTPGNLNCIGQSVSALARQYGGFIGAADALDYPSVPELQDAILEFCEPSEVADRGNREHHKSE